jgi:hypothetical protein
MTTISSSPIDPVSLRKILVAREHARADAWFRKDRRALEALLAPDFVEINEQGTFDRAGVFDLLFSSVTLKVFTINEPRLLPQPDDKRAILTYHCYEEQDVQGREIKGLFTVTAHYRKEKTQWQLVLWEIKK